MANIYLSIYNNKINKKDILKSIIYQKKTIRYNLGKSLNSKFVPELAFYLDESYEIYDNINKIIKDG
mgnify:CR=1 FL=1